MAKKYKNGQIVEGVITGIQGYGAFVSIDEDTTGLIHISEISDDFVRDIHHFVHTDEKVLAKIIDVGNGKQMRLSLKALNHSFRKTRNEDLSKRSLVPEPVYGFSSIAEKLPKWVEEKENTVVKVDLKHAFLEEDVLSYQEEVSRIHKVIHEKTGKGNDYIGWLDWADRYDKEEFSRIKECAKRIQKQADVLLVCGIGGSYLGARAAIEIIQGNYQKNDLEIIYVGNTFSSTYLTRVMEYIKDKEVACNVISKSGTTTETALAFRIIRKYMEERYGEEEAARRIYATTDASKGLLKPLADKKGYETFVIPDDIGGRFSVITPVGLLPIAAAGIDIDALMDGVRQASYDLHTDDLANNPAYTYAVVRNMKYRHGKSVEMMVTYDMHLVFLAEWWKQLFSESEGKEEKALLPASVNFSTDLHSLGQFIQDGSKILFETVVRVEKPMEDMVVPNEEDDLDELNYLAGKSLDWINEKAFEGTLEAHEVTGHVANVLLSIEEVTPYNIGYLFYFFFKALAMSAYMIDVNPFDQPGVEVYKKNMFRLLGKK